MPQRVIPTAENSEINSTAVVQDTSPDGKTTQVIKNTVASVLYSKN
jgi:hypothetical protein